MNRMNDSAIPPADIKTASKFMIAYAVYVLIFTLINIYGNDFDLDRGSIRGLVRFFGVCLVSIWLLKLNKAAWWFAVIQNALLVIAGVVSYTLMVISVFVYKIEYLFYAVWIGIPLYLLVVPLFLLLKKENRRCFS